MINSDNVILPNNKYIMDEKEREKRGGIKSTKERDDLLLAPSESINKVWHIFYLLQLSAF